MGKNIQAHHRIAIIMICVAIVMTIIDYTVLQGMYGQDEKFAPNRILFSSPITATIVKHGENLSIDKLTAILGKPQEHFGSGIVYDVWYLQNGFVMKWYGGQLSGSCDIVFSPFATLLHYQSWIFPVVMLSTFICLVVVYTKKEKKNLPPPPTE